MITSFANPNTYVDDTAMNGLKLKLCDKTAGLWGTHQHEIVVDTAGWYPWVSTW